jgi:hypothetical protein
MASRRKFGSLSRATRDRYARAGQQYGLSRRSVREMYNRGTFNPGSRGEKAVPRKFRGSDLSSEAYRNIRRHLGDYLRFNDATVRANVTRMSPGAQAAAAFASEDELIYWAEAQNKSAAAAKHMPRDWGWFDAGHKWRNLFWYH